MKRVCGDLIMEYELPDVIDRPSIIAVHGMWGSSGRWMENYSKFFAGAGYPFFAINLRGHGHSRPVADLGRVSVHDYVKDVKNLVDYVAADLSICWNPILFGHSMGGLVVQKVAETLQARAVVLINSAPPSGVKVFRPEKARSWILALSQAKYYFRFLRKWKAFKPIYGDACRFIMNGIPPEKRKGYYEKFNEESGRAAMEILSGRIPVDEKEINCPMLVIGCEEDRIVIPEIAEDIYRKYKRANDQVDCLIYKDFAHWIQVEPGWQKPARDILAWLEQRNKETPF